MVLIEHSVCHEPIFRFNLYIYIHKWYEYIYIYKYYIYTILYICIYIYYIHIYYIYIIYIYHQLKQFIETMLQCYTYNRTYNRQYWFILIWSTFTFYYKNWPFLQSFINKPDSTFERASHIFHLIPAPFSKKKTALKNSRSCFGSDLSEEKKLCL